MPKLAKFLTQSVAELDLKYTSIKRLQHERLSSNAGPEWSMKAGLNHDRNRYTNIVPYDRTRVKLKVLPGYDDYINASHINIDLSKEYSTTLKRYIASHGPTRSTTDIFWQMCFDEVSGDQIVIVMVTPLYEQGFEKCYKYWPETEAVISGDLFNGRDLRLVKRNAEMIEGEFIASSFDLTDLKTGKTKKVSHLYYDQWQDFSKPVSMDPVKKLSDYANKVLGESSDPIVVHCSAGVGRTGTFITLNYILTATKMFDLNLRDTTDIGEFDIVEEVVLQLRLQRLLMVERFSQFLFIYQSLASYYTANFG